MGVEYVYINNLIKQQLGTRWYIDRSSSFMQDALTHMIG
jgi:hypothetical protein